MAKFKAKAEGARVRSAKDTGNSNNIAGLIPEGYVFDGTPIVDGFTKVELTVNDASVSGIPLKRSAANDSTVDAYIASAVIEPVVGPQPPVPPIGYSFAKHLGVSVLIDARAGRDAYQRGCRAILYLNNTGEAIDRAREYPDLHTVMRVWWGSRLTAQQMATALDAHRSDIPANCYTTVLNECDTWCYGSPEEIRERFNVEREVCEIVWRTSPNRIMCPGAFSHGTPDTTREDIRRAWRDTYGAFAVSNKHRIRLNWHLYTKGKRYPWHPPNDASIYDPMWFEGRDNEFWMQTFMPQDARCISDEMFVEAGHGGAKWAGYSDRHLIEWAWWWLDYKASNYVQHDFCLGFQYGDHPGWQGYDCRYLADTLGKLWRNEIPRPILPRFVTPEYAPPPAYEVPPAKSML